MRDLSDVFTPEKEKNVHRYKTVHRRLPEHIVTERATMANTRHGAASPDMVEVKF